MPYKIPLMQDINNLPKNGYTAISLFAGGGGSSTGYKIAGFNVLLASEFIKNAADTYKANHPTTHVLEDDIRNVSGDDILRLTGLKRGQLDLFDGSPPCAPFSLLSRNREGKWGNVVKYSETKQRVDDLYDEYVRLALELQPKVIVSENVEGLTKGDAETFLRDNILKPLSSMYNLEYRVLKAKFLGVPQNRPRFILIGVRKDLGLSPKFPTENKTDIVTVREAWKDMVQDEEQRQMLLEKCLYYYEKQYLIISKIPKNQPKAIDGSYVFNGARKNFNMIRISYETPSNTITSRSWEIAFGSGLYHPEEDRKLTIPELKRIHSYPDDYILTGTYEKQYERIARSVPPLMMAKIAKTIKDDILDNIGKSDIIDDIL